MHKVLLVELAALGRFHRAVEFPYLAGFLDNAGVPWKWLRFAVDAERPGGRRGLPLPEEDLRRLARQASTFAPTRIVFNRIPDDEVIEAALAGSLNAVHVLGDTTAGSGSPPRVERLEGGAWAAWVDIEGRVESTPHFGYVAANPAAERLQPLPFLVFGAECTYDRPLSNQPPYRGLDLSKCVRTGGCAFCNRGPNKGISQRFSSDGARRQLAALATTLPHYDGRVAVRLHGEPALAHIEHLAPMIRDAGMHPADWLLDARADRLVSQATPLARASEILSGSGHKLHVALVGIESFVRADLERFNKGVDPIKNLDAILSLLRLERDHPESFSFRSFGGLSTIFFTPWTTLEDLAFNLRVVQQCGLADVAAKVLGDRIRLEPALPITALAERDGLLTGRYDDPMLDTASRNFYGNELPWRFADARMEPFSRLFVRLWSAASGKRPDDPLGERVAATWQQAQRERCTPVDLALRWMNAPAPDPERILDAYESPPSRGEDSKNTPPRFQAASHLVDLCRQGIKPVSKIEPLSPLEAEAFLREVQPPNPRARSVASSDGQQSIHLFFGESEKKVDAAIRWATQAEEDPDDRRRDEAVAEAGKSLGYPSCCAKAFAFEETPRSRLSYVWMHLHRRVSTPGEVDPLLHPWATTLFESFVPCSLACDEAISLMRRAEAATRELEGDEIVDRMLDRACHPWLVVLEGQGSALELIPESEPSERFRFAPGRRSGASAILDQAAIADELVIEHERLVLLDSGRRVVDLSMQAFVWWHARALQTDFWTRVFALRGFMGRGHHDGGRASLDVDSGIRMSPRLASLKALLTTALSDLVKAGKLGRLSVKSLVPVSTAMLSLTLEAGAETVELYVAEAGADAPVSNRVGPFLLMRPAHEALQSPVARAAVRVLSAQLGAWVKARQLARRAPRRSNDA